MGAELLIPLLSGLCCLSALVVVVVAAVLLLRRSKASSAEGGGPAASSPALQSGSAPASSPFPASASAELGGASGGPSGRAAVGMDVEDFDEDGPTTLVDTVARRPGPSVGPSPRSPQPLTGGGPRGVADVPAPDEPPPLPRSHAGDPPSSRKLRLEPGLRVDPAIQLDPRLGPDTSTLQPGATIIPPDDWHDDYIDDDEADETMLMARPPLPPKK